MGKKFYPPNIIVRAGRSDAVEELCGQASPRNRKDVEGERRHLEQRIKNDEPAMEAITQMARDWKADGRHKHRN